MRKLVGLAAVLALMGACSKKNASLEGSWKIGTITVNGKTQPLDDCTQKPILALERIQSPTILLLPLTTVRRISPALPMWPPLTVSR